VFERVPRWAESRATAGGSGRAIGRACLRLAPVLALALTTAAGCAIPFGGTGDESAPSTSESSAERRRERNRLFLEEQERMERNIQFDRAGPPSDR
jgi:hypothetical protein